MRGTQIDFRQIEGWTRKRNNFLADFDLKLTKALVPLVPSFIETYHLTFSAIPLGILIIIFSYLARENIQWLWGVSLMIILRHIADALDGEIGRQRGTGLVKWGMYADHLLDYAFTAVMFIGYAIIFPQNSTIFYLLAIVLGGHFVNEFLKCINLGSFNSAGHFGIGPTELQTALILTNALIVFYPSTDINLIFGIGFVLLFLGLVIDFNKTQKLLWKIDMKAKSKRS